jgi:hypothetical protein
MRLVTRIISAGVLVLSGAASAQMRDPQPIQCGKVESECLRALGSLAERRGEVLTLRFRNGKTKSYTSSDEACEEHDAEKCVRFYVVGYHPAQQLVIIGWQTYENGGSEVVHTRSGTSATLADRPEFSPNGRWFVSIGSDDANDNGYDVRIWETPADGPRLAFDYRPPEGRYESWTFRGWESNRRIKLTVSKRVGDQLPELPAEAVYGEGAWRLRVKESE